MRCRGAAIASNWRTSSERELLTRRLVKHQVDAAIAFAFVFNLANAHRTDFTRVIDVRTATGLEVDVANAHGPYVTGAARRLYGHRSDQFRSFVELGLAYGAENDGMGIGDEIVDTPGQVLFVNLVIAEIEVEPAFVRAD